LNPIESEVAGSSRTNDMATYHQYSEIVAAYGNRLPPPARPQGAPRITLPLIYAAVGAILGTFTGTAAAVVSLQPNPGMALSHFSFASSRGTRSKIHAIANAGQPPAIQNHAITPIANTVQPLTVQDHAVQNQTFQNHSAQDHTAALVAKTVEAPVVEKHETTQMARAVPPAPVQTRASESRTAGSRAASQLAKTVEAPPMIQTKPVKLLPSTPLNVASVEPVRAATPVVHQAVLTGKLTFTPPSNGGTVQPRSSDALPVASAPAVAAAQPLGADSGLKSQVFYSEGDATVTSYDAAGDTIATDDGRTFVIGTTVSVSSATSWDDYRANVHYRCDQNGNCTLTRSGVIALNAKLI
jgi:hypothetical protein